MGVRIIYQHIFYRSIKPYSVEGMIYSVSNHKWTRGDVYVNNIDVVRNRYSFWEHFLWTPIWVTDLRLCLYSHCLCYTTWLNKAYSCQYVDIHPMGDPQTNTHEDYTRIHQVVNIYLMNIYEIIIQNHDIIDYYHDEYYIFFN